MKKHAFIWPASYAAITILSAVVVWIVGHRGVFLYDQSGFFDAAWRLLQGQVLYRDFYAPYPPVAFWIQALFFRIAGVDFSSMVLSAAVLNSLTTGCVIWLVRRLLPEPKHRPTALAAGLLTAVWFQAPFGTLWFEQTSFFFNIVALVLLVETEFSIANTAVFLRVVAGCLLSLSILSKHNAGLAVLPVPLGVAVISCLPNWRKAVSGLVQVSAGILLVFAMFGIWLWAFSSPSGFWRNVVVMSGSIAGGRMQRASLLWGTFTLERTWSRTHIALLAFSAVVGSGMAFSNKKRALISWILIGYVVFQNLFSLYTLNEVFDTLSYLGIIDGLAFGLLIELLWMKSREGRLGRWATITLTTAGALTLLVLPFADGWLHSWWRTVQEFDSSTQFSEPLHVPGMTRVRWGNPTWMDKVNLTRTDFENLNTWLTAANCDFFVFPDSTLLYGLHKRISPQPFLYFIKGHTFREEDIPAVDASIVESLKKNKITVIVLEKTTWSQNHKLLKELPKLQTWINDEFQKEREFGIYEIWRLRSGN
jgi:4-amino-4-deoxy-L-arabinose transferase-like glycosyltransferase